MKTYRLLQVFSRCTSSFIDEIMAYDKYLVVHLARVAVGEGLATAAALQRLVRSMQLLHVDPQVCLTATLGRAQLARVHRLLGYYSNL